MLKIRDSQMNELAESLFRRDLVRLSQERLVDLFPDELAGVTRDERLRRVEYGVLSAFRLGLTDLVEIRCYAEAALLLGVEFESSCEWVHALISPKDPAGRPERFRILCIQARMSARLRATRVEE
ncbi:MAG: hypothetical protein HYX27_15465 [Acidobacteria bacterium]|nr:hypothetical protein [Acidobacteriota bacterium]